MHNWATTNTSHVFIYQKLDHGDGRPFTLGIQTKWQLDMMNIYGKNSILAMDATFGTNKYKVCPLIFYFKAKKISHFDISKSFISLISMTCSFISTPFLYLMHFKMVSLWLGSSHPLLLLRTQRLGSLRFAIGFLIPINHGRQMHGWLMMHKQKYKLYSM